MRGTIAVVIALLVTGCASQATSRQQVRLEFRLVAPADRAAQSTDGLTEATVVGTNETVWLEAGVLLSNADIRSARAAKGRNGPEITLTFTKAGQDRFTALTEKHINRRLAVVADRRVLMAPVIRGRIFGRALVSGRFTYEEAKRIAAGIVLR